ncbi:hypothetical protein [Phenylobacterium sp.]|uniref:hypothetical protein n=1 Tax=Phenylobacterium sp. TaxID=1871053 RepID=UPI00271BD576|nr:hypothetical protein [Phenylobacterium sp.]MDO8381021.1 hypothetical protein [Phenylobacterium sp.]
MRDPADRSGIADFLFGQFRDAVQDIRSKLVDEGWFGRRSAPPGGMDLARDWSGPSVHETPGRLPSSPSFEEQWAPCERGDPAPDPGAPSHDIGVDR